MPDYPETGLGGHGKWTDAFGKGWLHDTNKKLDDWLKKRGLNEKAPKPYTVFKNYGRKKAPRGVKPEQLPDVAEVPGVAKRRKHKPGDDSGDNASRPVPKPDRRRKRKGSK
jgi:hypothetical protein